MVPGGIDLGAAQVAVSGSGPPASTAPSAIIRIQNVHVEYGQAGKVVKKVLNGNNLDIAPGEFGSIVGQTRCGKPTLLRLGLAQEMPPSGQAPGGGRPPTPP